MLNVRSFSFRSVLLLALAVAWAGAPQPSAGQALKPKESDDRIVGYLGLAVEIPGRELAAHLGLEDGAGLVVVQVVPSSPAEASGFREHDVLLRLDDQLLFHPHQFSALVRRHEKGERVTLEFIRRGQREKIEVTLDEREDQGPRSERPGIQIPWFLDPLRDLPSPDQIKEWFERQRRLLPETEWFGPGEARPFLGVVAIKLEGWMRKHLEIPSGTGVVIVQVVPGSPADDAGIRPDDILLEVAGTAVRDPAHLASLLRTLTQEEPVRIALVREGKPVQVEVRLREELRRRDFFRSTPV